MVKETIIDANPRGAKRGLAWKFSGLFLTLALAVELFFLLSDLAPLSKQSDLVSPGHLAPEAPIAELVTRQNSVRVEAPGDLVWEDSQAGQILHRRESVLTLDQSRAEIAFLDGTGLMLGENSLVQLETSKEDSTGVQKNILTLLRGSIQKSKRHDQKNQKTPARSFEIHVNHTVATVAPSTELTVVAAPESSPGGARITVREGQVELRSGTSTVQVKSGEEAMIPTQASQTPIVPEAAPFDLIVPTGESASAPTLFKWTMLSKVSTDSPIELQVSTDPQFKAQKSGEYYSKTIPATNPGLTQGEVTLSLPSLSGDRKWYWKLRALKSGRESETQTFWQAGVKKIEALPSLPLPAPSAITPPPLPPPPRLHEPEFLPKPQSHHGWLEWLVPDAWADENFWTIHLQWDPVPGVQKYRVQVGKDRTFKKVIAHGESSRPEWDWTYRLGDENSKGRAFYRVASIDAQGQAGPYSDPLAIQIPESILKTAIQPVIALKPAKPIASTIKQVITPPPVPALILPPRNSIYSIEAGAVYQWRNFIQNVNPSSTTGAGWVPSSLGGQLLLPAFPALLGEDGWLAIEASAIIESAVASTGDRFSLPTLRFALLAERPRLGAMTGFGLAFASTQSIGFAGGKLISTFVPLEGVAFEVGKGQTEHSAWRWKLSPSVYALGALGGDLIGALSWAPVRSATWLRGLFLTLALNGRLTTLEQSYGAGLMLGYGL